MAAIFKNSRFLGANVIITVKLKGPLRSRGIYDSVFGTLNLKSDIKS
jgi:hypothetical protein